MRSRPIYRDGKVHVLAEKCETCIFRPGNLMRLNKGRVAGMVKECLTTDTHIPCHEFMDTATPAICRGFYDAHGDRITTLQIAKRLGMIEEQP